MKKNRKGDYSEISVIRELIGLGYDVHIPWGDNTRHDLLVEVKNSYKKIQVKTLYNARRDSRIKTELYTNNPNTGEKKYYSSNEVDAYALYYPDNQSTYWVWFGEAPDKTITLALEYNGNQPSVRLAQEYLIEKKL